MKGFEGLEDSAVGEVDAMKEMERAKKEIQEREERKAITMGAGGAPAAPRMNITVCFIRQFFFLIQSSTFLFPGKQTEWNSPLKTSIIYAS